MEAARESFKVVDDVQRVDGFQPSEWDKVRNPPGNKHQQQQKACSKLSLES